MEKISHVCRREAHADAVGSRDGIYRRILNVMHELACQDGINPLHVCDALGLPITSVRPRMTEMANAEFCLRKFNLKSALIRQSGFIHHPSAGSRRITGYVVTERHLLV